MVSTEVATKVDKMDVEKVVQRAVGRGVHVEIALAVWTDERLVVV